MRNKTKGRTTSISQATKTAHRCALIWFAISSEEVYKAVMSGDVQLMNELGLKIEEDAFRDFSNLAQQAKYKQALQACHEMWLINCSPPPCLFSGYEEVLQKLEEDLGSQEAEQ